jgi:hypothetical protein
MLARAERRRLRGIERQLGATDPELAAMFGMFARLSGGEGVPPGERECARSRWRRLLMFIAVRFQTELPDGAGLAVTPAPWPPRWPPRNGTSQEG